MEGEVLRTVLSAQDSRPQRTFAASRDQSSLHSPSSCWQLLIQRIRDPRMQSVHLAMGGVRHHHRALCALQLGQEQVTSQFHRKQPARVRSLSSDLPKVIRYQTKCRKTNQIEVFSFSHDVTKRNVEQLHETHMVHMKHKTKCRCRYHHILSHTVCLKIEDSILWLYAISF